MNYNVINTQRPTESKLSEKVRMKSKRQQRKIITHRAQVKTPDSLIATAAYIRKKTPKQEWGVQN